MIGIGQNWQMGLFGLADALNGEQDPLVSEAAVVGELQAVEVGLEGSPSAVVIVAQL